VNRLSIVETFRADLRNTCHRCCVKAAPSDICIHIPNAPASTVDAVVMKDCGYLSIDLLSRKSIMDRCATATNKPEFGSVEYYYFGHQTMIVHPTLGLANKIYIPRT